MVRETAEKATVLQVVGLDPIVWRMYTIKFMFAVFSPLPARKNHLVNISIHHLHM